VQAETGLLHRRMAHDAVLDRALLAPQLGERESRGTLSIDGGVTESDARGDVSNAEIDTGSVRFAAEAGLTADMHLGLGVGYTRSDVSAGRLGFETTGFSGDVYGGLRRQRYFVDASIGGGFEEYDDIRRLTSVAPAIHEADTDGWNFGAAVRGGLIYEMGGGVLSPRIGLDFTAAQVDGYSEDGPMARQLIDERRVDALAGQISLRYDHRLGDTLSGYVEGGYRDYFSYDGDAVSAGLVDNPARRLLTEVDEPDDGVGLINAGLSGTFAERFTVSASYRGRFGDGYESNTGRLAIGMAF